MSAEVLLVEALYDFDAESAGLGDQSLSFRYGDEFVCLEKTSADWWRVLDIRAHPPQVGYVPATYVQDKQKLDETSSQPGHSSATASSYTEDRPAQFRHENIYDINDSFDDHKTGNASGSVFEMHKPSDIEGFDQYEMIDAIRLYVEANKIVSEAQVSSSIHGSDHDSATGIQTRPATVYKKPELKNKFEENIYEDIETVIRKGAPKQHAPVAPARPTRNKSKGTGRARRVASQEKLMSAQSDRTSDTNIAAAALAGESTEVGTGYAMRDQEVVPASAPATVEEQRMSLSRSSSIQTRPLPVPTPQSAGAVEEEPTSGPARPSRPSRNPSSRSNLRATGSNAGSNESVRSGIQSNGGPTSPRSASTTSLSQQMANVRKQYQGNGNKSSFANLKSEPAAHPMAVKRQSSLLRHTSGGTGDSVLAPAAVTKQQRATADGDVTNGPSRPSRPSRPTRGTTPRPTASTGDAQSSPSVVSSVVSTPRTEGGNRPARPPPRAPGQSGGPVPPPVSASSSLGGLTARSQASISVADSRSRAILEGDDSDLSSSAAYGSTSSSTTGLHRATVGASGISANNGHFSSNTSDIIFDVRPKTKKGFFGTRKKKKANSSFENFPSDHDVIQAKVYRDTIRSQQAGTPVPHSPSDGGGSSPVSSLSANNTPRGSMGADPVGRKNSRRKK
eukprot:Clim_evm12s239 gene=Clim_evmTU12s239